MTTYRCYALDNDRNELATVTVDAADVAGAIKLAEARFEDLEIECADIEVIADDPCDQHRADAYDADQA